MIDTAKYLRICNPEPDDEYVSKRETAIKSIVESYKKKTKIDELISLGSCLAQGLTSNLPEWLNEIVSKAIKKQSASFLADEQALQIRVCALIALLQYLDAADPAATATDIHLSIYGVLATSVWSSFSFQSPLPQQAKFEELRIEIVKLSENIANSDAYTTRNRLLIPAVKEITLAEGGDISQLTTKINKVFLDFAKPMITNCALDREEINVLWWTLNDWSEIANMRFSEMNDIQRAIIGGIEISNILRRLPARAHFQLGLRTINYSLSYTGHELLDELSDKLGTVSGYVKDFSDVRDNPESFPLFSLLKAKQANGDNYNSSRSITEWCGRALVEGSMMNMEKFLNDGDK